MLDGWLVVFRGLSVCQRYKRIWGLVILPVLLNFLVFVGLFYLGAQYLSPWLVDVSRSLLGELPAFVRYLFLGLFIYVFYLFVVYFFNTFGLLIGSFFYTLIAARVYHRIRQQRGEDVVFEPPAFLKVVVYELKKFAVLTVGGLVVSFLGWLMPYIGWLFLGILILFLAFEYFDYGFEGLNLPYKERLRFVRNHIWTFFSAGLVTYLILSIPLVGFMICPLCVVGSTDLVYERALVAGAQPATAETDVVEEKPEVETETPEVVQNDTNDNETEKPS